MSQHTNEFRSRIHFDPNRIRAAAIYCSDGRFGEQFDDFLHNSLGLPRYDRLAVPGGAGCLAGHFLCHREEDALVEQTRFLFKVHALERIVLIAHHGCAFYAERLHVPSEKIEHQQREDMVAAVRQIHSVSRSLEVDAFFARKHPDGSIGFEPWALK